MEVSEHEEENEEVDEVAAETEEKGGKKVTVSYSYTEDDENKAKAKAKASKSDKKTVRDTSASVERERERSRSVSGSRVIRQASKSPQSGGEESERSPSPKLRKSKPEAKSDSSDKKPAMKKWYPSLEGDFVL